jgi:hypothetical protein
VYGASVPIAQVQGEWFDCEPIPDIQSRMLGRKFIAEHCRS